MSEEPKGKYEQYCPYCDADADKKDQKRWKKVGQYHPVCGPEWKCNGCGEKKCHLANGWSGFEIAMLGSHADPGVWAFVCSKKCAIDWLETQNELPGKGTNEVNPELIP